ncbi:MAG: hypothetical protein K2Q25_01090 [Mycobacteriaceae bacterium]|nr:hypothetical protein [Mycobacteriaceae bacterium]
MTNPNYYFFPISSTESRTSSNPWANYPLALHGKGNNSSDLDAKFLDENSPMNYILTVTTTMVIAFSIFFAAIPYCQKNPNAHKDKDKDDSSPNRGDQFLASRDFLQGIHDTLQSSVTNHDHEWTGDGATYRATQGILMSEMTNQMANIGDRVHAVLSTQAGQVEDGRRNLENVLNELKLAMPISEALYFSGPAGPTISWHFQLATANSAISVSNATTREMNLHAGENGCRLNTMTEEYNRITTRFSP